MDKIKPRTFEELLDSITKIINDIEKEKDISTCHNPRFSNGIFPFDGGSILNDDGGWSEEEVTQEIAFPIEFECDSVSGNGECNPVDPNEKPCVVESVFCCCDEPIRARNWAGGFEFEVCRKCKKEIQ